MKFWQRLIYLLLEWTLEIGRIAAIAYVAHLLWQTDIIPFFSAWWQLIEKGT